VGENQGVSWFLIGKQPTGKQKDGVPTPGKCTHAGSSTVLKPLTASGLFSQGGGYEPRLGHKQQVNVLIIEFAVILRALSDLSM
jgi:hypothetical protein